MKNVTYTISEIKPWLLTIFKKKNIKDLSVKLEGNAEKGEGHSGDIVFVHVSGITDDDLQKEYDLVIKCSKPNQILRELVPLKEAYRNEIYVYNKILPYFREFQLEKGIKLPFNSVPKCYGTLVSEDKEVVVLENLKKSGYGMWPQKDAITRNHLNLVLGEYAKFHAISVALKDQRPDKILEFDNGLIDVQRLLIDSGDTVSLYTSYVDEIAEMLEEELEEDVLLRWKELRKDIRYVFYDLIQDVDGLKVIGHGDCWNNNYMFMNDSKNTPTSVSIVDWQLSKYTSPAIDVANHIFTCISGEDLNDLGAILQDYHRIFSEQVTLFGSDPEALYPFNQFLEDWKKYCKFGILMGCLSTKMCSSEKDEVVDLAEAAQIGRDYTHCFAIEIKDKTNFKKRIRPIVEYVVKNNLI